MAAANQAPTILDYAAQLMAGTAAILALSFGGDPAASNRIGFYGDLTATAEKVCMVVGGQTGPIWTRNGSVVDVSMNGAASIAGQFTSTLVTGTAPFVVASTTVVGNLNVSQLLGATWAVPGTIGSTTPTTGKFTTVTATGLTSGRVAIVGTSGLLSDNSAFLFSAGILSVGAGTGAPGVTLNGAAGNSRIVKWQTGSLDRWQLRASSGAEGGADAGTALVLAAYDDTGANIDNPITITRAAGGAMALTRPVSISSTTNSTAANNGAFILSGGIGIADGKNISTGTTSGTIIATATNQKLGFFNATPVNQQAGTGTSTGFTAGAGTGVTDQSTFTGAVGSTAYRISDIVKALKNLGFMAQ